MAIEIIMLTMSSVRVPVPAWVSIPTDPNSFKPGFRYAALGGDPFTCWGCWVASFIENSGPLRIALRVGIASAKSSEDIRTLANPLIIHNLWPRSLVEPERQDIGCMDGFPVFSCVEFLPRTAEGDGVDIRLERGRQALETQPAP
jgi:hypothetical protein